MSNNKSLAITISPEIPHHIIERTFEGLLLKRLVTTWRTGTGYEISSSEGVSRHIFVSDELVAASRSGTPLALGLRAVILAAVENKEVLGLDDMARALHQPHFDVEHVLQAICKLYPNDLPYFEILWSVSQGLVPEHGRVGGGAQFVTADGVKSLTTLKWIEEQRASFNHEMFQIRMDWDEIAPGTLYRKISHTDWRSIVNEDTEDFVQIRDVNGSHEVSIQRAAGVGEWVDTYRSLKEAMLKGGKIADDVEENIDAKILASMGLSEEDWTLEMNELGMPVAFYQSNSNVWMQWEKGEWFFLDDGTVLARSADPSEAVEKASGTRPRR